MNASRFDIKITRGVTYGVALVTQVKRFVYDPDVHNGPADLKRSHAENLDFYGYVWEYVDFASLYTVATLEVYKPWKRSPGDRSVERTPIATWALGGNLSFTDKSVDIGVTDEDTEVLSFEKGTYKLKVETAAGEVDYVAYGDITVDND